VTGPDLKHGSRWWKVDFHAHTPHSSDWERHTPAVSISKDAPEDWLRRYMDAGIDAVAITDHNGGGYVDRLKAAYVALESASDRPDWFGPLALFPGVEITVSNGHHLLAIFDPSECGQKITQLLDKIGFDGRQGDANATTPQTMKDVCQSIVENGGVAIPAHVDKSNGLLETEPGKTSCKADVREVERLITSGFINAFELCDLGPELPEPARRLCKNWPCVVGTDWHNWRNNPDREPGQRFTWVKMGTPNLEGLKLALQEGCPGSIRRFDEVDSHPITPPAQRLTKIRIRRARYAGRNPSEPLDVPFSPWLTTLIGGRGSGKSTVVQMLRLALGRGDELADELSKDFERFARQGNRSEDGALTGDTRITIGYIKNGQSYRLEYAFGQPGVVVHEIARDGTASVADGGARDFPVRIFSQKQIYQLAGNTSGLLTLVDETLEVDRAAWTVQWDKAIAEYRSVRARARAERAATANMPTLRHQKRDIEKQLDVFEFGDNKSILRDYQRFRSQKRHFEIRKDQSVETEANLQTLIEELAPPDPPLSGFDGEDPANVSGRELMLAAVRDQQLLIEAMRTAADAYAESIRRWTADLAASSWSARSDGAQTAYTALVARMTASGIQDPNGYTQLIRDKQLVESRLATAAKAEMEAEKLEAAAAACLGVVVELRKELTRRRRAFLNGLPPNDHVHIEIRGFGTSAESAEPDFRAAVNKVGATFANDIRNEDDTRGLLARIYDVADLPDGEARDAAILGRIDVERNGCLAAAAPEGNSDFSIPFVKHLRALDAEQLDRLRTWWPEDDVHVKYRDATGQFRPIGRASAGEKSAAVLAFILSHGEEPLILDQPEDDLDNHLIFHLIVKTLGRIKSRRQVIVITHNPNIVVNGDAELVNAMAFAGGQIILNPEGSGCLQDAGVRQEVCDVMEGGRDAFERRYRRVVKHVGSDVGAP